jgi:drug/metabolite transporter (DMT)-like permease
MMKWMFLAAFIFLSPLSIPELPQQRLFTPDITLLPILQLGYSILFSSIIGFFLMSVAVKRIKTTSASMYINVQPLAASTAAIIIGQDVFSWDKPLVLLLIFIGVFFVTRGDSARK